MAKVVISDGSLIKVQESLYKYENKNQVGNWIRINTQAKTCMCQRYQDKLVCKHLVAACLKDTVRLEGLQSLPRKILTIRKRKRQEYLDNSLVNKR